VTEPVKIAVERLGIRYAGDEVVRDVDLDILQHDIFALIGPAGSGKTSLLRTLNLLSLDVDRATVRGRVLLDGTDLLQGDVERASLRRRVALVFATPQPLPGSVYYNRTWTNWSSSACAAPSCGKRSKTDSIAPLSRCLEGSSSVCASRARWRCVPR
jgi:ABC-type phosphate transport system ATPase subunit